MKHRVIITTLAATFMLSSAQGNDAILDILVRKGVLTQQEANQVREQADVQTAQTFEIYNKSKTSSWLDSLTWSGDLRLRADYIGREESGGKIISSNTGSAQADQLRFRYRLRLALEARFPEWMTVNVRLASGDGDPVSTNTSLSDTFRKKPITLDIVSATIQPPGWDWAKLIVGKMENTIWQPKLNSPMVYDNDVTPEGIAEQIHWSFGDQGQHRLFANFGQFALKEISGDANDVYMFDLQSGIEAKFGGEPKTPKLRLQGLGGFYFTQNLGNLTAGDSPNLGNAFSGSKTNYFAEFNVMYFRGEAAWQISERPFCGTPCILTLSGEYDENLTPAFDRMTGALSSAATSPDQTTGWTVQLAFGEAKKKGQWMVAYQYKHLEADATFDGLTDSDWGNGGTDRKGHAIRGSYNFQDWWTFTVSAFVTEKISNRPNSGRNQNGLAGEDHFRVLIDNVIKF